MDSIPSDKLHKLSHIKRFAELLLGDPAFRADLRQDHKNTDKVAKKYNLDIDIDQLRSFWHNDYKKYRFTEHEIEYSPLTVLWDEHLKNILLHRDKMKSQNDILSSNKQFALWRKRQLLRSDDTLATSAPGIIHPSFAFELSEGCTVGCWFCGISAEKFKGYFPYSEENQKFWREMLLSLVDIFGLDPVKSAFCYWASDPSDNPDYVKFIEDFYKITQFLPQTTTARPLKELAWTREILRLYEQYKCVFNRFSITTLSQLREVHKNFSPLELIGTELVMHHKQALSAGSMKSPSGRVLQNLAKLEAAGKDIDKIKRDLNINDQHTTIACVSGFLINPLTKTIKLISPRAAGLKYPLGYKVHASKNYSDIDDFITTIHLLINEHMPAQIPNDYDITLNRGLKVDLVSNGFKLISQSRELNIKNLKDYERIGHYFHSEQNSGQTYKQALKQLAKSGCNIFTACNVLQSLYQYGAYSDG